MIRYLVPSRGRPANVRRLREAWRATRTSPDTQLFVIVDDDDETRNEYVGDHDASDDARCFLITSPIRGGLGPILNEWGTRLAKFNLGGVADPPEAIGFMGDDHVPRTPRWDVELLTSLRELGRPGIVYGNDLLMGANLPTAVLMSGVIPRRLGFMAPPGCQHMYLDNFWRDLGTALGAIRYRPDVVIEHVHPVVGKAPHDAQYERTNAPEVYAQDATAYREFTDDRGIERCVELIRG